MNRADSTTTQLKDQDLVKWIENKLGDQNELWAGRQAASLLTKEMLVELETCFQASLSLISIYSHVYFRALSRM